MTTAFDELKTRLNDESPEVRRRAVIGIYDLPADESVELIMVALSDDDWRVRKEATQVAKELTEHSGMIELLVENMLQEEKIGLRNAALEVLISVGKTAVDTMLSAMPSMELGGKMMALEVLGNYPRDPRAANMLIQSLADPDPNVRVCAAEWLGELNTAPAREALLEKLSGTDRLLSLAALQSLNRMKAQMPWSILEPLTSSKLYGSDLLWAIGRSESPAAAPTIFAQLESETAAMRALEILHDANDACAEAVEKQLSGLNETQIRYLVTVANDGEPPEQRSAASCLLWSRNTNLIEELVGMARNESLHRLIVDELRNVREESVEALERLLTQSQGFTLASVIGLLTQLMDESAGRQRSALFSAYLGSADIPVATAAAGAIARFGGPEFISRLLELVRTDDLRLQRIAGHALVEIGRRYPEAVRDELLNIELEDESGIQLCRVFEVVGKPEDASYIAAALGLPNPKLRQAVLGALATVAGAGAVETISLAMTDEDVGVRTAAAAALARVGPAAAETIVSGLRTAQGPVRAALIHALGLVGHPEAAGILRSMCRDSAEVVLSALDAMRRLGLDPGDVEEDILTHTDSEVVKQGLALFSEKVAVERLIDLLGHDAWDVRLTVIERLEQNVHLHQVAEALGRRLYEEKDDLVKGAISRALTNVRETR